MQVVTYNFMYQTKTIILQMRAKVAIKCTFYITYNSAKQNITQNMWFLAELILMADSEDKLESDNQIPRYIKIPIVVDHKPHLLPFEYIGWNKKCAEAEDTINSSSSRGGFHRGDLGTRPH